MVIHLNQAGIKKPPEGGCFIFAAAHLFKYGPNQMAESNGQTGLLAWARQNLCWLCWGQGGRIWKLQEDGMVEASQSARKR